jgi:hypothetical protein
MTQHNTTNLTLCIPRVDSHIEKQDIFNVFKSLRIGYIGHISEIPLKHDTTGKRIVVKFKTWVENELSKRIMERLDAGKDIKIVFKEPGYWLVTKWNTCGQINQI